MFKYILDARGDPIPEPDLLKWAAWIEVNHARKIVRQDSLPNGTFVSTVFLGLDHNFIRQGPPVLWETMIFRPDSYEDMYCKRYTSLAAAKAGHRRALRLAKQGNKPKEGKRIRMRKMS